jgi:Cu/Ag efflux protein CusF
MRAMSRRRIVGVVLVTALAAGLAWSPSSAQQPQTTRLRGVIEKVDGNTLTVKGKDGAAVTLNLAGNGLIVAVVKASLAEIKEGSFIGSGAMPQADGTQKALEVHIFAESQRGTGEGHRAWDGAPNSTMTNGTVGASVASVDGGVITVKYKDGEKKIVVPPGTPIMRYEIGNAGDLKPGASFTVIAATKKPDGSYEAGRINVGRDGAVPQ